MIEVSARIRPDGEVVVLSVQGFDGPLENESLWEDLNSVLSGNSGWDRDHVIQAVALQASSLIHYLIEHYFLRDFTVTVCKDRGVEFSRFEYRVASSLTRDPDPPIERVSRYEREPVI